MSDPTNGMLPPPASPTNSSISSSDLDTESTGSFFHDRSTTLGTLMGVTFTAISFRPPSQPRETHAAAPSATNRNSSTKKHNRIRTPAELRRRRWWSLCKDGGTKPASLGEFLEVERRFEDAAGEFEGVMMAQPRNGRLLFADGRVLPPEAEVDDGTSTARILCRFPVSLTGICCGGVG